ncbi:MAG: hypothetical protein H6943_03310 [Zoogloeaceae bacterium]|nr:hypothetical protein [Zoogloeaceae bacterium]
MPQKTKSGRKSDAVAMVKNPKATAAPKCRHSSNFAASQQRNAQNYANYAKCQIVAAQANRAISQKHCKLRHYFGAC